jgi:DNA-binding beta-propeller fold protein YncE
MNFGIAARRLSRSAFSHFSVAVLPLIFLALASCGRTEVTAQAPPPPPALAFISEWGTHGGEPGQLSHPEWLAVDFTGNVFIADSGSGYIQKFTAVGHPLLSFDDRVPDDPFRVAVDSGAGIYVLGQIANSIFIFSPEGEPLIHYLLAPVKAHQRPQSIAVDDAGDIFAIVSFRKSSDERVPEQTEIREYSPRGRYRKTLTPVETSGVPFVPASLAAGSDGHLYVLDASSARVQKFTLDGDFVAAWGNAPTSGSNDTAPLGVGIGVTSKYVFTPDSAHRGVLVWMLDGQPKLGDSLGDRLQNGTGTFQIAASSRGELIVLDAAKSSVLRFRINF